jgi:ATP/maltotriose-dependent transcriptional regulator MalT
MRSRPIKVRIEAEGSEAGRLLALAASEGLILAKAGEAADLVARPAEPLRPAGANTLAASSPGALPSPLLSARELEILAFLVDGWSNAEIASALGIGLRTVRFHLEGAYAKLGVARRGEAAREALRLGLVRFDA